MDYKTLWIDFMNTDSSIFFEMLKSSGYDRASKENDLSVWVDNKNKHVKIEILVVDTIPREPVSYIQEATNKDIDKDRREYCVPLKMDPFLRCLFVVTDETEASLKSLNNIVSQINTYADDIRVLVRWQN